MIMLQAIRKKIMAALLTIFGLAAVLSVAVYAIRAVGPGTVVRPNFSPTDDDVALTSFIDYGQTVTVPRDLAPRRILVWFSAKGDGGNTNGPGCPSPDCSMKAELKVNGSNVNDGLLPPSPSYWGVTRLWADNFDDFWGDQLTGFFELKPGTDYNVSQDTVITFQPVQYIAANTNRVMVMAE